MVADARAVIANPAIDIVIELIGGYGIARTLVMEAIAAGKHVVTANKALLAVHGSEIFAAALDAMRLAPADAVYVGNDASSVSVSVTPAAGAWTQVDVPLADLDGLPHRVEQGRRSRRVLARPVPHRVAPLAPLVGDVHPAARHDLLHHVTQPHLGGAEHLLPAESQELSCQGRGPFPGLQARRRPETRHAPGSRPL